MRIIVVLGLLLVAGCVSDDQACQDRGFAPGTGGYDNCRSTLALNRQEAATLMSAQMATRPLPITAMPSPLPAVDQASMTP